ncbi:MAG: NAD(P)H-dependent oxidoreductase subunit E [Bacilli bacterium]|nr:NAD(P)H-dependent oxidoreductase subunit E [Bacilli bacterium]
MAKLDLSKENFAKLQNFIDENRSETMGLMPVLHAAQEIFGCIPLEVQKYIAKELSISVADIYGVVTFYSRFSTEPVGDNLIGVCLGTACYVKGSQAILDRFKKELGIDVEQTTEDGKFTLTATRCLGACGLAPVVTINNDVYGKLVPNEVPKILAKYQKEE